MFLLFSCAKEPITPGNYGMEPEKKDTTSWQSKYIDGGATPNSGWVTQTTKNDLFGTDWRIIDLVYTNGYNPPFNQDTIHFINNTNYTINSDTTQYTYSFYTTMGNATLTFNEFKPINTLYLTCNNLGSNAFKNLGSGQQIILKLKESFNDVSYYTMTIEKI